MIVGLERVIQCDDEWMVAGGQDLLLSECSLDLIPFDHLSFAQYWNLISKSRNAIIQRAYLSWHTADPISSPSLDIPFQHHLCQSI